MCSYYGSFYVLPCTRGNRQVSIYHAVQIAASVYPILSSVLVTTPLPFNCPNSSPHQRAIREDLWWFSSQRLYTFFSSFTHLHVTFAFLCPLHSRRRWFVCFRPSGAPHRVGALRSSPLHARPFFSLPSPARPSHEVYCPSSSLHANPFFVLASRSLREPCVSHSSLQLASVSSFRLLTTFSSCAFSDSSSSRTVISLGFKRILSSRALCAFFCLQCLIE